MNSSHFLQISYDHHLAFSGLNPKTVPYELVKKDCEDFNRLYEIAVKTGTLLSAHDKKSLKNQCVAMLSRIFVRLQQASESLTKDFFVELGQYSVKLLQDDLNYLMRTPKKPNGLEQNEYLKGELIFSHYFTGKLPDSAVQEILAMSRPTLDQFQTKLANGCFKREDLSVNKGLLAKKIVQVLNREYKRNGVLDAVSFYRSLPTHVIGCALELSDARTGWWNGIYPQYPLDTKTAYFHFDEAIAFPKSIVYLTDTTVINGATSFILRALEGCPITHLQFIIGRICNTVGTTSGTALHAAYKDQKYHMGLSSEVKRSHFMALPREIRFNSHLGFDIIPDSEQEKEICSQEKRLEGKAGTFIVFDGSKLLHRGGLVAEGSRIALQIVFGKKLSVWERAKDKIKRSLKG